jgi:hypothetical protein
VVLPEGGREPRNDFVPELQDIVAAGSPYGLIKQLLQGRQQVLELQLYVVARAVRDGIDQVNQIATVFKRVRNQHL